MSRMPRQGCEEECRSFSFSAKKLRALTDMFLRRFWSHLVVPGMPSQRKRRLFLAGANNRTEPAVSMSTMDAINLHVVYLSFLSKTLAVFFLLEQGNGARLVVPTIGKCCLVYNFNEKTWLVVLRGRVSGASLVGSARGTIMLYMCLVHNS